MIYLQGTFIKGGEPQYQLMLTIRPAGSSTKVEHLPQQPKDEGLNLATLAVLGEIMVTHLFSIY
jgi:hypothetical protein